MADNETDASAKGFEALAKLCLAAAEGDERAKVILDFFTAQQLAIHEMLLLEREIAYHCLNISMMAGRHPISPPEDK